MENVMSKLLRNWDAIAKIGCPHTKDALAMCTDQALLWKLFGAFNDCFRVGDDNDTDRFSWKRILQAATELSMVVDNGGISKQIPYTWLRRIRSYVEPGSQWADLLSIPVFESWRSSAGHGFDGKFEESRPVPAEIVKQLKQREGHAIPVPFLLTYKETRCVVGDIDPSPTESEWNKRTFEYVTLVRAEVICFDC
jgi:hypothetical protein